MERLKIKNARLVLSGGILECGCLLAQDGKIVSVGQSAEPCASCAEIDAEGRYVSPGFIDMHVHGGGGHDFMDCTAEAFTGAARAHLGHGTTTLLPTTLAGDDGELEELFSVFRRARASGQCGANLPGLHLEGPYFSMEQRGAQDPRYLRVPEPAHYNRILALGGADILRWSMAPELDGAHLLGDTLKSRGILPSAAHTDATFEQIEEAMGHGFTHLTHFYSGMCGVRRVNGMRQAGAVEAGYTLDGLTVEAIGDGIHLPPPLLRMISRCIGPHRAALITDAMRAAGQDVSESTLGSLSRGVKVLVNGGVAWLADRSAFAGSVATMDRCVRTMVQKAGASLTDAVAMAASTPARIMGFKSKGIISPGMDADLVLFDGDINVSCVIVGGRAV